MDKHRCKLCLKNFANGRALGGHMRSHMLNLYVPPKPVAGEEEEEEEIEIESVPPSQSPSRSPSSSSEENGGNNPFSYGLRENPRKSIRLVDPGFCFAAEAPPCPASVQDGESETESTRNAAAAVRRRSKRIRRHHYHHRTSITESDWVDPELPVSSISDTTTEEDVAYCLMMLSRDQWRTKKETHDDGDGDGGGGDGDGDGEDDPSDESDRETKSKQTGKSRARSRFVCETCNRVFKSYQALGGHRASHKKMKSLLPPMISPASTYHSGDRKNNAAETAEEKVHECPVCYRVFASGQALGGHKRSHFIVSSAINGDRGTASGADFAGYGDKLRRNGDLESGFLSLIDLNLPAPVDDEEDEISQIEVSAVSDG